MERLSYAEFNYTLPEKIPFISIFWGEVWGGALSSANITKHWGEQNTTCMYLLPPVISAHTIVALAL
jgi:hypothetical protein